MGGEADAMWDRGMIEQGREDVEHDLLDLNWHEQQKRKAARGSKQNRYEYQDRYPR